MDIAIGVIAFIGIAWLLGGGIGKLEKQLKGKKKK